MLTEEAVFVISLAMAVLWTAMAGIAMHVQLEMDVQLGRNSPWYDVLIRCTVLAPLLCGLAIGQALTRSAVPLSRPPVGPRVAVLPPAGVGRPPSNVVGFRRSN